MTDELHERYTIELTDAGWIVTCCGCGAVTEPYSHPLDAGFAATAHFEAERAELENAGTR